VWLLAGFAAAGASGIWKGRSLPVRLAIALAAWIAALALSAVFGTEVSLRAFLDALLPCVNVLLMMWIAPRVHKVIAALAASATLVASIAILQYFRFDPFGWFNLAGSMQGNTRILVFATLGNPNFVASFLVAVLPLTFVCALDEIGTRPRRYFALAALIQAGAIFATGSRAPILALLAAGAWLLVRRQRSWLPFLAGAVAVAAVLLALSPARPLDKTIAGRLYIWKVIGRNIPSVPFFGFGPGAFPLRFAEWETAYLRLPEAGADRDFAGLQDHAHNDYLEFAVEHGIFGLAALVLALGLAVRILERRRVYETPWSDGIIAGILALLSAALVDFPLHRPAALYLLWLLIALLWISDNNIETPARPCSGP
jgi:putative inorganic carbon (HCO3(-)) transporter